MRYLNVVLACLIAVIGFAVFADDLPVNPDVDFFTKVSQAFALFGGMTWAMKVASVVMLIIASMKVSFLAPLWQKMGAFQTWLAPILGLVAGVLSLGTNLTFPGAINYVFVGAGAIVLHQLLDTVKAIPGLGTVYVTIINFIEALPVVGSGAEAGK